MDTQIMTMNTQAYHSYSSRYVGAHPLQPTSSTTSSSSSNNSYIDFNRELTYDYSNNTFNPKISLRSYCFAHQSSSTSSNPNSTSNSSLNSPVNSPLSSLAMPNAQSLPQFNNGHRLTSASNPNLTDFSGYSTPLSSTSSYPNAFQSATNSPRFNDLSSKPFVPKYPTSITPLGANPSNVSSSSSSHPAGMKPESPSSPVSDSDGVNSMNGGGATGGKKKKRCNLPKKTTKILIDWLNDNLSNPYPNSKEKFELIVKTGLTNQQLSNWFINARRRKINNLRENQLKNNMV
ncbi:Cup9 protein [Saccharomycopsis crataegensis]|uniref:Cup9 protein n=1 Tax=Saccharomycopsis crataegensis TaxID=43959 RepID=A0AAV5QKB0_9ASCO|nr:Cup9 protein [Saccharomycopsis crataegensis]